MKIFCNMRQGKHCNGRVLDYFRPFLQFSFFFLNIEIDKILSFKRNIITFVIIITNNHNIAVSNSIFLFGMLHPLYLFYFINFFLCCIFVRQIFLLCFAEVQSVRNTHTDVQFSYKWDNEGVVICCIIEIPRFTNASPPK